MTYTDVEIRNLAVELLKAPTARDTQNRIGASNLSNQCNFCLACNLTGDMRDVPMLDRAYGGRVLGTAIHGILESRMNLALGSISTDDAQAAAAEASEQLQAIARRHPDAEVEKHAILGVLGSYGPVGTTPDLVLPSEEHLIDWKGSTLQKLLVLLDYIAIKRGEEAPYGRKHAQVKLSEKEYAKELEKAAHKVIGYFIQLTLYMWAKNNEGVPIRRASIVFIARDSTMWFDNPGFDGYDDPQKYHGVAVLSFDYDEQQALAAWNRGLQIWEYLAAGGTPDAFESDPSCFPCGLEGRAKPAPVPAEPAAV